MSIGFNNDDEEWFDAVIRTDNPLLIRMSWAKHIRDMKALEATRKNNQ